jgi:hypothetical protein
MPRNLQYTANAYWCAHCWDFVLECSHLVEPMTTPPYVFHDSGQYIEARWDKNILQVRTNTGEGFQFTNVPRRVAIAFVKNPDHELLKGYRFERVRGR